MANQTRPADRTVVVLSHTPAAACGTLQAELVGEARLVCDPRQHRGGSTGANRNIAALACGNDTTYVAYLDADDEAHPKRLETMVALMEEHKADLGLHDYALVASRASGLDTLPGDVSGARVTGAAAYEQAASAGTWDKLPRAHNGHVVVRRAVLHALKQREDVARGQDSLFVRDVVSAGYRAVHTSAQLTVYHSGTGTHSWYRPPRERPVAATGRRRRAGVSVSTGEQ